MLVKNQSRVFSKPNALQRVLPDVQCPSCRLLSSEDRTSPLGVFILSVSAISGRDSNVWKMSSPCSHGPLTCVTSPDMTANNLSLLTPTQAQVCPPPPHFLPHTPPPKRGDGFSSKHRAGRVKCEWAVDHQPPGHEINSQEGRMSSFET